MPVSDVKYHVERFDDGVLLWFYRENDIGARRWETYEARRTVPFGKYVVNDRDNDLAQWIVRDLSDRYTLASHLIRKLNEYLKAGKAFKRKGRRNGRA